MGCYTEYAIKTIEDKENKCLYNALKTIKSNMDDFENILLFTEEEEFETQQDFYYHKEMLKLSILMPNVTFLIKSKHEYADGWTFDFYKNGKHYETSQEEPEFDETKLN